MFEAGRILFTKAVMDRVVLMLNHVIAAEPVAIGRLMPHAGKTIAIRFDGWPSLLPALPSTVFVITPAGLVEGRGDEGLSAAGDLTIGVDASNPALAAFRAFTGDKPDITISGDAGFAGDVNWLVDNLRWDIEDDLAKLIGDGPAHELSRFADAVNGALKKAAGTLRGFGKTAAAGPFGGPDGDAGDLSPRGRNGTGGPPVP